jgi:hypothetical protein
MVKFVPVPGVPCEISAAKECPPEDGTVATVPGDALLYAHLTLDHDTTQYDRATDLAGDAPDLTLLAQELASRLPTPSGARIDFANDVATWANDDFAFALLPGAKKRAAPPDGGGGGRAKKRAGPPGGGGGGRGRKRAAARSAPSARRPTRPLPVFIAGVAERTGAQEFLGRIAPPGKPRRQKREGATLSVYPQKFAAAFAGDRVVFGAEAGVRAVLRADAGRGENLEESGAAGVRDRLPAARFADVYLSRAGVRRILAGRGPGATQLETFVDYGATDGIAASASAREGGVEVNLVSSLDPGLVEESPPFFAELPEFEPRLAEETGPRALGYIAVGEVGPTLTRLLGRTTREARGLARSLRSLARDLRKREGVDPLRELLPALGGQAALVAEPSDGVPFASLIVEGVDEERASAALARLQRPLLRALQPPRRRLPGFEEQIVEGVTIRSVETSPTVTLAYALFEDKLVVSTDPAGVEQVLADEDGLASSESYRETVGELPDDVAALVFLNLDELLGLAEQAGLAEDPLYASLSDDIAIFRSLGLAVTSGDDEIHSELFLAID